jgi:hypothetical protein
MQLDRVHREEWLKEVQKFYNDPKNAQRIRNKPLLDPYSDHRGLFTSDSLAKDNPIPRRVLELDPRDNFPQQYTPELRARREAELQDLLSLRPKGIQSG